METTLLYSAPEGKYIVPNTKKGEAKITYNTLGMGDQSQLVSWQPGNGTHYRLLFTPMSRELVAATGFDFADNMGFMVTWIIPGERCPSYAFSKFGQLHYQYVQEKLCHNCGSAVDASELTRIIGITLKREVMLCTDGEGRGL